MRQGQRVIARARRRNPAVQDVANSFVSTRDIYVAFIHSPAVGYRRSRNPSLIYTKGEPNQGLSNSLRTS